MKCIVPEAFSRDVQRMSRFEREARVLASLNHPNIAAIYGLEESGSIRALVMELVEGPTLADHIRNGPIPDNEALPIARQIAEAIEYAHDKNVIHRDLKPPNIKLTSEGTVKVLDFGLAKAMSEELSETDIGNSPTLSIAATRQGIILGTASYMAPEQAKGKSVDRRADVWAFGAVLYEMLTGKQAFPGEDVTEILAAVVMREPSFDALPASTPAFIRVLLQRCLTKDIRQRLQHIGEARYALEHPGGTPFESAIRTSAKEKRPQVFAWSAAAVAILIAIVLGWALFTRRNKSAVATQPIQFQIPVDPGGNLNPLATISPDGSLLAYFDTLPNGGMIMRIRAMDSGNVKDYPATETALPFSLFWSPDSKTIYFGTRRFLKRMDVARGAVQQICDCGADSGTVNQGALFCSSRSLRAKSQEFLQPAKRRSCSKVQFLRSLFFLPDGKRYLFLQNRVIFLASLDQPQTPARRLTDSAARFLLANSPNGSYLFVSVENGNVQALPFNTDTGEITGPAVVLPLSTWSNNIVPSASSTGIFVEPVQARWKSGVVPVWFDKTGRRLENAGPPGMYGTVDLSPDGTRLASLMRQESAPDIRLWVRDLNRNTTLGVTPSVQGAGASVWGPNGGSLVFAAPGPKSRAQIYRADASNLRPPSLLLEDEPQSHWPNDWSRDGKYLLYAFERETATDLWVLEMDKPDAKPTQYTHADSSIRHGQGQFSPDGKFVAYVSDESGRYDVYVQPFPDASKGKWVISQGGGFEPRWSRDGRELFFFSGQKLMEADVRSTGDSFSASAPHEVFSAPIASGYTGDSHRWQLSQDGKRFLLLIPTSPGSGAYLDVVVNWEALLKR